MEPRFDIAVIDNQGVTILAVEAKVKWGTDSEWASQMRRNLAAHGVLPRAHYYLLALPDQFYLWNNGGEASRQVWLEPIVETDAASVLEPYFEQIGINTRQLNEETFEFVLLTWLNDMIDASNAGAVLDASSEWLDRSGLYNAFKRGRVATPQIA